MKILIIDREASTLNDISRLVVALKYEPVVAFNTSAYAGIIREEISAVFVDIEAKGIKVTDVVNYFNSPSKLANNDIIPIFFLYTKEDAPTITQARQLPHADTIKKPVNIEHLFETLRINLKLDENGFEHFSNLYRLKTYKEFSVNMNSWLDKLGSILNN